MEKSHPAKGKRKNEPKVHTIGWAVYDIETESKKLHRLVKPVKGPITELDKQNAPVVSFRRIEVANTHALHIMHHLNDNNILRMRGLDQNETEHGYVNVHVEPTVGLLLSICDLDSCADRLNHIPSDNFQIFVRGILKGITFLSQCWSYHGDLSWENTLYAFPYAVKLSGFRSIVSSDHWLHDRLSLANMLQELSTIAHESGKYICDDLDDLIAMLQTPAMLSSDLLENTFFWDMATRRKFYTDVVSLKLKNGTFNLMIRHSHICALPWKGSSKDPFDQFVAGMDKYRTGLGYSEYDGNSFVDFLMCICGGYSHRYQLEESNVDFVICRSHPRLCLILKRLVNQFNSSGFACNARPCKICCPSQPEQWPRPKKLNSYAYNRKQPWRN